MRSVLAQAAAREVGVLATIVVLGVIAGWVIFTIFGGRWIYGDAKRRGHPAAVWATLLVIGSICGFVPGVIVLIIYVFVRDTQIHYTDQGHLHVPRTPPELPAMAPPPAIPLAQQIPSVAPAGVFTPGPVAPIALSRVKCPRCQSIFEYQRAPEGKTHVKCPSCGEEGNI